MCALEVMMFANQTTLVLQTSGLAEGCRGRSAADAKLSTCMSWQMNTGNRKNNNASLYANRNDFTCLNYYPR